MASSSKSIKKQVILFKADWCGHCVRAKPYWESMIKDPKLTKKYTFICYDSEKNADKFKEFNVSSFPTLIVLDGKKRSEVNVEPSEWSTYLNKMTGGKPKSKPTKPKTKKTTKKSNK